MSESFLDSRYILESLKNKAIADLEKEFRTMVNIQKSFLALEKWRIDADIKASEDYSVELDLRAHHPDQIPDFKPATPVANPSHSSRSHSRTTMPI